jgi:hypothetical protein
LAWPSSYLCSYYTAFIQTGKGQILHATVLSAVVFSYAVRKGNPDEIANDEEMSNGDAYRSAPGPSDGRKPVHAPAYGRKWPDEHALWPLARPSLPRWTWPRDVLEE